MQSLPITLPADSSPKADGVDRQIDISLKRPLGVRFYGRHVPGKGAMPLVVHFHAGAFVGGSLDEGSAIPRLLAEAGAVVMSLDYPLSPEHPFPQAVEAGYAALVWAWQSRQKLAGKGAPLFVAGEEAGGNLAAAVALMARDQQEPKLTGQLLLSPMLDPCMATASLRCADAGPVGCKWADGWHNYLSRFQEADHPYAAPGKVLRLNDLPPTLLITAEDDPLRDEALAYAERLRAAGLLVHAEVLTGPTGWPASYLAPANCNASWEPAVGKQFKGFFASLAARLARPAQSYDAHAPNAFSISVL